MFSMFQVDLELHQEFSMANQYNQPDLSDAKVKRLQKIIIDIIKRKSIKKAEKPTEEPKEKTKEK